MKLFIKIKTFYENLSLIKKIFIVPFLSIIFGLYLLYTSHQYSKNLANKTNLLHTKYVPLFEKSNQNIAILNQLVETYSFIVNTDEEDLYQQSIENSKKIQVNLQFIQSSNIFNTNEIETIINNYQKYNTIVEQSIYNMLNSKGVKLSNTLYLEQMFHSLNIVQNDFHRLHTEIKKLFEQNKNDVQNILDYIKYNEIENIITTYLLLLLFSWFVYISVNKRFKNLISTISTLSKNSLALKGNLHRSKSDEISFLSDKINEIFQDFEEKYKKLDSEKQKYTHIATVDQLTQISNRYYLTEMLTKFDNEKRIYGLAILDIDKFKSVNDTYGHDVGDIVLQEVAKVLTANTRKSDIVGRWGGEEFIIILNIDNEDLLLSSLEKVRVALQNTPIETVGGVTASFGAILNKNHKEFSEAFKLADLALYDAKNSGRNQVKLTN